MHLQVDLRPAHTAGGLGVVGSPPFARVLCRVQPKHVGRVRQLQPRLVRVGVVAVLAGEQIDLEVQVAKPAARRAVLERRQCLREGSALEKAGSALEKAGCALKQEKQPAFPCGLYLSRSLLILCSMCM